LVRSFFFTAEKKNSVVVFIASLGFGGRQPHPASGESISGMPRSDHASYHPESASPEDRFFIGCGLAEILEACSICFTPCSNANVETRAFGFSEAEFP